MSDDIIKKLNEVSGGNDIGNFVTNYRTALDQQYEADKAALENQRRLDQTSIMSNMNTRGLLHSSFPTVSKLQYDTSTYEPNMIKTRQSYQSGLDSLYNSVAKYYNQIKKLQEKISDYNSGLIS